MQRSVQARSEHPRRHARMHVSPITAKASTYMHACAPTCPPTCREVSKHGLQAHAATCACTRHQPLLRQSPTCTRVSRGPTTCKEASKQGLHTHANTRACTFHRPLLRQVHYYTDKLPLVHISITNHCFRQARTCTRVPHCVQKHAKKRLGKVCTHA
jgi:hypothetical protein